MENTYLLPNVGIVFEASDEDDARRQAEDWILATSGPSPQPVEILVDAEGLLSWSRHPKAGDLRIEAIDFAEGVSH